jgi:TM2 domain-containing membrane protein YozV
MSPASRRPPRSPLRRPGGRSIAIAIILSLIIPGLGHVYIGRFARALIWFIGALGIGIILDQQAAITPGALVVLTVLGVLSAIDALVMLKFFQPKQGQ